jgi:hypothetical protein
MGEQAKGAPEVHFNSGSLSFWDDPNWEAQYRSGLSEKNNWITARIGTDKLCVPGLINNSKRAFPEGVCPVVDIEFPARKEGDPPIKKQYPLNGFC